MVRLLGTVTEMEWVNPHAVIHLAVKNPDGTVTNWAIEGNTPNSLLRAGLTKKSLAPGTALAVQGYLAKSGEKKASASVMQARTGSWSTSTVQAPQSPLSQPCLEPVSARP